ncbi:putative autoinducer 2 (AI-2E family) transporter [Campylobacter blaseri]|uniref:AI-2E family transporter n=1 Tax=Campylobacter blaseri TaxID=2042961 RepID=A0A2P8R466_9BACT|nr:AI-2E family transporter [Campylobacter blaseri]PSM53275.1 AI-2E family transporter [Campylobacter blaseri]PSM54741.1 AI-2E family transporter [Campylobacter blaseri]QKF86777.1 putative autoinducer 2 (AI-2E family) transporter [Campylobacter blaseri]
MKSQKILISLAAIVIILAGLKAASGIVVPFLLAVFIAIIVSPLMDMLEKIKIPRSISFLLVSIGFFWLLTILGNITFGTMYDFMAQLPEFQRKFSVLMDDWIEKINSYDIITIDSKFANLEKFGLDPNSIFSTTSSFVKKTGSIISTSFFLFLMVAFMLFETRILKDKVAYMNQQNPAANVFVDGFVYNLKRYLLIKTIASATTGLFIGTSLWYLGIPYAKLWGILAFFLNYIPTIGSIVAAIPAIFVTLISGDLADAFWVLGIYLTANMVIGSIIEPKFLGDGLGISTIIVLLSLLLWGYVFGIGGLFLAVPITMSLQIALNINPKTKFISVLLSNKVD